MTVLVWITEGTWQAAIDAARTHIPADTDITLLYVTGDDIAEAAHGSSSTTRPAPSCWCGPNPPPASTHSRPPHQGHHDAAGRRPVFTGVLAG